MVHAEGAENAEGKSKRRRGDMLPKAEAWHRTRSLFPLSVLRALCVNLPFLLLLNLCVSVPPEGTVGLR